MNSTNQRFEVENNLSRDKFQSVLDLKNEVGYKDTPPSKLITYPWKYVYSPDGIEILRNEQKWFETKIGKWLIFISRDGVDKVWEMIERETELGNLGPSSKVSGSDDYVTTQYIENVNGVCKLMYGNIYRINPKSKRQHVICVYTKNYTDEPDVMRVREHLRTLGFNAKMPYKSDEDTRAGKYASNGTKNISKYYC